MSKRSSPTLSADFFLQICLGAFFLALGILGLTQYNSKTSELLRAFGRNDTLKIITAVLELVVGGLLVLGLFFRLKSDLARILGYVMVGLWALLMFLSYILNGFFEPDFLRWLVPFSRDAVILVSLWIVCRRAMA